MQLKLLLFRLTLLDSTLNSLRSAICENAVFREGINELKGRGDEAGWLAGSKEKYEHMKKHNMCVE